MRSCELSIPVTAMLSDRYLNAIKAFEGFTPRATADYKQMSNGFGTKARFAGETITVVEAERRFRTEIEAAEKLVDHFAPGLDEGTKAALTSLTYNAGPSWMRSGLGELIKRGSLEEAAEKITEYNRAGGKTLSGLMSRRLQEAAWMGRGVSSSSTVAQNAASPNPIPNPRLSHHAVSESPSVSGVEAPAAIASTIIERLVELGRHSPTRERERREIAKFNPDIV